MVSELDRIIPEIGDILETKDGYTRTWKVLCGDPVKLQVIKFPFTYPADPVLDDDYVLYDACNDPDFGIFRLRSSSGHIIYGHVACDIAGHTPPDPTDTPDWT